jgi:2,4-dienoyl-CoA reductase-like NADH-dependent reductase (Old Yellow Enzyme family)
MSRRHSHLLSTGRIGGMQLRNRIAMAAMGTNLQHRMDTAPSN